MSSRYSDNTHVFFEVLGSCYAHLVYNDLYANAVNAARGGANISRTDSYRNVLTKYSKGLDGSQRCITALNYIHSYFNRQHRAMSLKAFETELVGSFFPPEYMETISTTQQNSAIKHILQKTIRGIINKCLTPRILAMIIDNHQSEKSVEEVREHAIQTCIIVRESNHTQLAKSEGGLDNDAIPATVVNKLQERLNVELERRKKLEEDLEVTKRIMRHLAVRTQRAEATTLEKNKQITQLKELLSRLRNTDLPIDGGQEFGTPIMSDISRYPLSGADPTTDKLKNSASTRVSARAEMIAQSPSFTDRPLMATKAASVTKSPAVRSPIVSKSPAVRTPTVSKTPVAKTAATTQSPVTRSSAAKQSLVVKSQSVRESNAQPVTTIRLSPSVAPANNLSVEEVKMGFLAPIETIDEATDAVNELVSELSTGKLDEYEDDTDPIAADAGSSNVGTSVESAIDDIIGDVMGNGDPGQNRDYFNTDVTLDDD